MRAGRVEVSGWRACLAANLVAIAIYMFLPVGPTGDTWFMIITWSAVATMVGSLVRKRPRGAGALWLFTAYGALVAGGVLTIILRGEHAAAHGPQDVFFVLANCASMAGGAWLIRTQIPGRDREILLDAAIITCGFTLLTAIFLIKPALLAAGSHVAAVVAVSYPVTDLFIVAVLVSLLLRGALRNPALRLVALSQTMILAVDGILAFGSATIFEHPLGMKATTSGTLLMYASLATATLHPKVGKIAVESDAERVGGSWARTPLLLIAVMSGPGLLLFEAWQYGLRVPDAVAIATGCVVIFGLVVARLQVLVTRVNRQSTLLEEQASRLRVLATRDGLTGLVNRRAWDSALADGLERARRYGLTTTVAIIDLDHFKKFNDTFGHQAGDRLLKAASAAWSSQLRKIDVLARYGGEEFIALLPDCSAAAAVEVLVRLRGVTPQDQTFSAGVATWDAVETGERLVARADAALYRAKSTGRARSVIAEAVVASDGVTAAADALATEPAG